MVISGYRGDKMFMKLDRDSKSSGTVFFGRLRRFSGWWSELCEHFGGKVVVSMSVIFLHEKLIIFWITDQ